MTAKRRIVFWTITVLLVLTATSICAEIVGRLVGFQPWTRLYDVTFYQVPVMHEPDPDLGWKNKPGVYKFPGYTEYADDLAITFWPGGLRATQANMEEKTDRVLIVGDSFTQGWTLSDYQTFGWKLQQKFPKFEFLNFASGGYGTYQSLLVLERYFANSVVSPYVVIYGFSDFHEGRNVGSFRRLASLALYSHIDVRAPYVLRGPDGMLDRYTPEQYADHADWPLKHYSVVITALEYSYMLLKLWSRDAQKTEVTQLLLSEMDQLVTKHRGKLLVVILSSDPAKKDDYIEYFQNKGIWFADCTHPKYGWPDMVVTGEGHPNAIMNEHWANCIENAIQPTLFARR